MRDGNLPSEMRYDFKSFEVVEVDFSNLKYRGYIEIDHRGFFRDKILFEFERKCDPAAEVFRSQQCGTDGISRNYPCLWTPFSRQSY